MLMTSVMLKSLQENVFCWYVPVTPLKISVCNVTSTVLKWSPCATDPNQWDLTGQRQWQHCRIRRRKHQRSRCHPVLYRLPTQIPILAQSLVDEVAEHPVSCQLVQGCCMERQSTSVLHRDARSVLHFLHV